ncbi:bile acid:sodium symporter family protein [Kocuria rhizophila]|uniref:bile acid:sodium symporter family protein n=1 Tax=Kocuria rhizophila TaxID=72000 RepID=UPI001EF4CDF6|nr:bile acid:sodium symporter family protein [Kocuria rhizophila]MCG7425188.1 bile acid:sodium symporter family protein [Kocuria rhizophila]MDN3225624.1 bile acid:sodium symporter family protein [Kocuria rhizophila]
MSTAPAPQDDAAAAARSSADRTAYVAVLVFPLLVLAGGAAGYVFAPAVHQAAPWTNPLLGLVMFGMGLTLRPVDFALVARRPVPILVGVLAQYVLMPGIAALVSWVLRLPPEIAAGVVLVGCAPGGTASNVVSYLARGDVAVSVTMTSISTLLAPLLTPLLTLWLAGAYMPLDGGSMAKSIALVVLLPVLLGLVVRLALPRVVTRLLPVLPWLSVLTIAVIVAIVVSGSAGKILQAGLLVLVAVAVHNALGMTLGWLVGRLTGQPGPVRRTTAIEVGMQNSGLAAGLAAQYMSPLAALPGAVFSVWHNLSGAVFALLCRRIDTVRGRRSKI